MFIALAIVAIGFLILIHEFGHFLVARACGMKVDSFSIGFGPSLLSIHGKKTEYRLSLLPLGGYVRIAGMAPGDGTPAEDPRSFANKPGWQKFLVILAGPFVNWFFAFLLLAGLLIAGMQQPSTDPVIGRVVDRTPAATVGLQSGDRILNVDGDPVATWSDFVHAIQDRRGKPMQIELQRAGSAMRLTATTGTDGRLGILPSSQVVREPVGDALGDAFVQTGRVISTTLSSLADLLRGHGAPQVIGPVGIVSETVEAARSSVQSLFSILVLISLALALMNLLPLPALDGGRLVFITIGMIRRRPVDQKVEAIVHGVGMVLLLGLVIYATYGDIGRQFEKGKAAPQAAQQQQQQQQPQAQPQLPPAPAQNDGSAPRPTTQQLPPP